MMTLVRCNILYDSFPFTVYLGLETELKTWCAYIWYLVFFFFPLQLNFSPTVWVLKLFPTVKTSKYYKKVPVLQHAVCQTDPVFFSQYIQSC